MPCYYIDICKNGIVRAHLFIYFCHLFGKLDTHFTQYINFLFLCNKSPQTEWLKTTPIISSSSEAQKSSMVCLGSLLRLKSKCGLAVFSSGFMVLSETCSRDEQNSVSCVCWAWVHNSLLAIRYGLRQHLEAAPRSSSCGLLHFQAISRMWNLSYTSNL